MYLNLIISHNRIKMDFKKVIIIINWESSINIIIISYLKSDAVLLRVYIDYILP